jgi:uncharacterized protein YhdP
LVNPLVGLGVLLGGEAFKNPLERVLSVQYTVSGKWDNPDVERVGKTTAKVDIKELGPPAVNQKSTENDLSKKNTP